MNDVSGELIHPSSFILPHSPSPSPHPFLSSIRCSRLSFLALKPGMERKAQKPQETQRKTLCASCIFCVKFLELTQPGLGRQENILSSPLHYFLNKENKT